MHANWQLQSPIDAIIFDCDGTLSSIEGIDVLAEQNRVSENVKALTAEAMGSTGINPVLYEKRLQLVKPTLSQVIALSTIYQDHQTPDAKSVIKIFRQLQKSVYIISAGLLPSIRLFGEKLAVTYDNIFAVDVLFDEHGNYLDFDRVSPLTYRQGKRDIVGEIKQSHPRIVFIGDGLNDLVVKDDVERFVGYGGAYYRENIASHCQFYLTQSSMAALLPLALTAEEVGMLTTTELQLYKQGLKDINIHINQNL